MRLSHIVLVVLLLAGSVNALTGMATLEVSNPLKIMDVWVQPEQNQLSCEYKASFNSTDIKEEYVWTENNYIVSNSKYVQANPGTYTCKVSLVHNNEYISSTSEEYVVGESESNSPEQTGNTRISIEQQPKTNKITGKTVFESEKEKSQLLIVIIFGGILTALLLTVLVIRRR